MEFTTILNAVCGTALGYLAFLIYQEAIESDVNKNTKIDNSKAYVENGEVHVVIIK